MKTLGEQIKQVKSKIKQTEPAASSVVVAPEANPSPEELFKLAVKDARPLPESLKHARLHHAPAKPKPIPKQFILD
ncbi:MAG: hypothetical protein VW548_05720, partial [Methylotenera sp.]